jgi:hypothetical protein
MSATTPPKVIVPGTVSEIKVRIAGFPVTPGISSGFYQAEEEALSTPIIHDNPRPRFYSALDAEGVSLQCDNKGRLIFVQVRKPRRLWIGAKGVSSAPSPAADIRFLDFRCRIPEPEYLCDRQKNALLIKFGEVSSSDSFRIGDNVVALIHRKSALRGLFIDCLNSDRAGKALAKWRRLVAGGSSLKRQD